MAGIYSARNVFKLEDIKWLVFCLQSINNELLLNDKASFTSFVFIWKRIFLEFIPFLFNLPETILIKVNEIDKLSSWRLSQYLKQHWTYIICWLCPIQTFRDTVDSQKIYFISLINHLWNVMIRKLHKAQGQMILQLHQLMLKVKTQFKSFCRVKFI